jgi:hypothetical protein
MEENGSSLEQNIGILTTIASRSIFKFLEKHYKEINKTNCKLLQEALADCQDTIYLEYTNKHGVKLAIGLSEVGKDYVFDESFKNYNFPVDLIKEACGVLLTLAKSLYAGFYKGNEQLFSSMKKDNVDWAELKVDIANSTLYIPGADFARIGIDSKLSFN